VLRPWLWRTERQGMSKRENPWRQAREVIGRPFNDALGVRSSPLCINSEKTVANPQNLKPFEARQWDDPRGRPRGSRHKLSERFLAELCEDLGGKRQRTRCAGPVPVAPNFVVSP
jgi:hypothetical protein